VIVNGPKRGNLEPDLVIDIADPTAVADLNGVTSWRLLCRLSGETTLLFTDTAPTVVVDTVDASKAVVTHTWASPQTDIAGVLLLEVEATWPGGRKQTFPTRGYAQVRISGDLG